jgi:hypothetical protein
LEIPLLVVTEKLRILLEGGRGSGFHHHHGIPGHRGGSSPSELPLFEDKPKSKIPEKIGDLSITDMRWLFAMRGAPLFDALTKNRAGIFKFRCVYAEGSFAEGKAEELAKRIKGAIPEIHIINSGTQKAVRPEKAGARGKLHYWVRFRIKNEYK